MSGYCILEGFQIGIIGKYRILVLNELNVQYIEMESIHLPLVLLRTAKCTYIEQKSFVPVGAKTCLCHKRYVNSI